MPGRQQPVDLPQPVVIVLCGGTSRRLAGRDKTREPLAGTTVMDHLLDALPAGWPVICVGEERATTRPVRWCRESPVRGGPVAGIAAALDHLDHPHPAGPLVPVDHHGHRDHLELHRPDIVVVLGGDMPFAAAAVPALVEALTAEPGLDAVLATDPDGRAQPLLAAYRREALRAALPREPGGARLMTVLDALVTRTVPSAAEVTLDVDTLEALEQARHIVGP